jgi:hypothetical protein
VIEDQQQQSYLQGIAAAEAHHDGGAIAQNAFDILAQSAAEYAQNAPHRWQNQKQYVSTMRILHNALSELAQIQEQDAEDQPPIPQLPRHHEIGRDAQPYPQTDCDELALPTCLSPQQYFPPQAQLPVLPHSSAVLVPPAAKIPQPKFKQKGQNSSSSSTCSGSEKQFPFYSLRSRAENEQVSALLRERGMSCKDGSPAAAALPVGAQQDSRNTWASDPCPSSIPMPAAMHEDTSPLPQTAVLGYLKQLASERVRDDGQSLAGGNGMSNYNTLGGRQHESGKCKPCLFWAKGLCFKGEDCTFCHFAHTAEQVQNIRPSKKSRVWLQRRTRQLDQAVKMLVAQNQQSQASGSADGAHMSFDSY